MLVVYKSRHFYQNTVLLRQTFYTGCPNFITQKAFEKIKLKQAKFRCEDGRPVYLKYGFRDKVLYWTTIVGSIFGTIKGVIPGIKWEIANM